MSMALTTRLGTFLIIGSLWLHCAHAQTQTRMSWQEFAKDPARVASFREAVRVMKQRDGAKKTTAEYRTSWQYWAAMHGYLGKGSSSGTVQEYIDALQARGFWQPGDEKYFVGVKDLAPPDKIAQQVWAQCEHGTPHFFLWHRLYLMQFEKVLRAAANDTKLRLPYWDYTNPAQTGLPAEFRSSTYVNSRGDTVDNPLHQPLRDADWASSTTKLDSDSTNIDDSLQSADFTAFQGSIETGIHGVVHCAISPCPKPAMGAVPYSANDPIFWLHHANIDRMLSCWANGQGHKIDAKPKTYTFIDPAGKPIKVSTKILLSGGKLDYVYDNQSDCARESEAAVDVASAATVSTTGNAGAARTTSPTVLGSAQATEVKGEMARVILTLTTSLPMPGAVPSSSGAKLAEPGKRTELVLTGIDASKHGGTTYKVFISTPGSSRKEYVGSLSFFQDLSPAGHHHGVPAVQNRTIDITRAAARLGDSSVVSNLEVNFEASSGRVGDNVKVQVNPAAAITIQEISIRLRSP